MENQDTDGSGESSDQGDSESQAAQGTPDTLRTLASALSGKPEESDQSDANGQSGETQDGDEGEGGKGESQKPPKTLEDAAKRLGLEVSEVYKLTVPDAHKEGESFTLGELKDQRLEAGQIEADKIVWAETRSGQQAELLRANGELEELVSMLPKRVLESDALKAVRGRLDERAARERAKTLDAIPEWKSETTRTDELRELVEHLRGYGFPPAYLAQVADHRLMRYFREGMKRQQRAEAALERLEQLDTGRRKPGKPQGGKSPKKPGSSEGSQQASGPAKKRSAMIGLMQPTEG